MPQIRQDNDPAASNAAETFAADAGSLVIVCATPLTDVDMNDTDDEIVIAGGADADEILLFFAGGDLSFATADAAVDAGHDLDAAAIDAAATTPSFVAHLDFFLFSLEDKSGGSFWRLPFLLLC